MTLGWQASQNCRHTMLITNTLVQPIHDTYRVRQPHPHTTTIMPLPPNTDVGALLQLGEFLISWLRTKHAKVNPMEISSVWCVWLLLSLGFSFTVSVSPATQYCIIGAGPAGIREEPLSCYDRFYPSLSFMWLRMCTTIALERVVSLYQCSLKGHTK